MTKDRDTSVDELLAATLKARGGVAPAGACLDAETVAAWADGALDVRERAQAEAHAADCARCQSLLAALVRTLPPAPVKSPWRMPALGWLVPLTVDATALVVWIAVPRPVPVQVSETAKAVDQVESRPSSALSSAPAADNKDAIAEAAPKLRNQVAPEREAKKASPALRDSREAAPLEKQPSPSLQENAKVLAETTVAPAAPPAGAAAGSAPATAPTPAFAPVPANQSADASSNLRREISASARVSAFSSAPETVVVSSNPSTRFRLLRGGGVQRSADAGATWRTEATVATETLTAGVSPSPSVCWLVGPSGVVLVSTDGRTWRRVALPDTADLRSVSATDAENATVTTVDGREFVTADGGRTWSRVRGI